ncbi:MAG TPA: hypothetical protein VEQ36_14945 [Thermomicrobiales bacterium]|nr:hypothetical protein [Thermomicrobiales bacterium]
MHASAFARIAAMLTVLGLLVAMAGPASAGNPEKIIIHDETDEELCGIPVRETADGWVTLHNQDVVIDSTGPDSDTFWIGVIQIHLDYTWTTADGVVLTDQLRSTIQQGNLVELGDGFWEYTYTIDGIIDRIRLGNTTLGMDRGSMSFREVFYLGDLSTQADNEFVSFEITDINGPHPIAENDFDNFCKDIIGALG